MKKIYSSLFIAFIFILSQGLNAQSEKDFKIIINTDNKIDNISKTKLSNIFIKKVTQWDDGTKIAPVDLTSKSFVREAFSQVVHDKDIEAIKAYWRKQVFSGTSVPPVEKENDEAVISYVKMNPGAIGYVSKNANTQGTKVINLLK